MTSVQTPKQRPPSRSKKVKVLQARSTTKVRFVITFRGIPEGVTVTVPLSVDSMDMPPVGDDIDDTTTMWRL